MVQTTALASTAEGELGEVAAQRTERMKHQAKASRADNSWRGYRADWRVWQAWAAKRGVSELPADAQHVAEFVSDMSASRKVSTIRRYLSSIAVAHELAGLSFDHKHATLRTIMKGIARLNAEAPRRMRPLTASTLRSMVAGLGDDLASLRDASVLALGVASGCRRGELACLDLGKRGSGMGIIELRADGATITLYRSKSSQDEAVQVFIPAGLALAAVRRWVEAAQIAGGTPLFRSIAKGGRVSPKRLSDKSIASVVKARCEAAGLDAKGYSGHSLRSGMITSAAEQGVPEWQIAQHSRHKSTAVMRGYIRPIEAKRNAVNIGV
jgi:integrase